MRPQTFFRFGFTVTAFAMLAASCIYAQSTPGQNTAPASSSSVASATSVASSSSAPVSLTPEQIASFRDYLGSARSQARIPGLAAAMVQPGRVLFLEGFGVRAVPVGDANSGAPVTPDTRFALGPVTQALNSLFLARLADANVVNLDNPARRCWSDFKLSDPQATHDATLSQLLEMTAGIPDYEDHILAPPHDTVADLFASLAQIPVLAQPGVTFSYSQASPSAAAYLATMSANHLLAPGDALPAAYVALIKAQLLDPLGLKHTSFDAPSSAPGANEAIGHLPDAGGVWNPVPPVNAPLGALTPAQGLRASAGDLAVWLQCELSGGLAADGSRLLSEDSLEQRWRPQSLRDPSQYGMGWTRQYYRGIELIVSQGDYDHQAALVVIIPKYRTALAVLLNGAGQPAANLLQDALLNFADFLREAAAGA
jgi:CubicO group peptidase (beta-lactamase class C family)